MVDKRRGVGEEKNGVPSLTCVWPSMKFHASFPSNVIFIWHHRAHSSILIFISIIFSLSILSFWITSSNICFDIEKYVLDSYQKIVVQKPWWYMTCFPGADHSKWHFNSQYQIQIDICFLRWIHKTKSVRVSKMTNAENGAKDSFLKKELLAGNRIHHIYSNHDLCDDYSQWRICYHCFGWCWDTRGRAANSHEEEQVKTGKEKSFRSSAAPPAS